MASRFFALISIMLICGCTATHDTGAVGERRRRFGKPASQAVSPQTYLRKLSFHLRGHTPQRSEYDELTLALAQKKSAELFKQKTAEYLTSAQHIDKMSFRLEELFELRPSGVAFNSALLNVAYDVKPEGKYYPVPDYSIHNSLNQLFREITARNLSWDTLLTGKNYTAFPFRPDMTSGGGFQSMTDGEFLSQVSSASRKPTVPTHVAFESDDGRIAGSLSTSRFFNRYGNTAINKNRRRAAAVFRIFLCDDMKAVVVDEQGNQDEILNRVFPDPANKKDNPALSDRHGSDPACLKCHYKLDPMGLTFQSSGLVLSPFASPGALVFDTPDGHKVNVPTRGLGELSRAITQQDTYVRCQVKHFWTWFIGNDSPLTESRLQELTAKFNEVQRRPNDFISYLVAQPEFGDSGARTQAEVMIAGVKSVLQNCNGCHAVNKIPSFTDWPIGGSESSHDQWLARIFTNLSLDGSGRPRKMPPVQSRA